MKYSLVFLLLSFLPAIHCLQAQQARQSHPASQAFQMITIPNTLTEPEERAIYLVEHYWDNFDFQDTSYIDKPEALEQALVDYLDLARYVPSDTMAASVTALMNQAEQNSSLFRHLASLMEKYLYTPESALKNEELFIPVLRSVIRSPQMSEVDKIRPSHLLELVLKNRIGSTASDFQYISIEGQSEHLHGLESDYTLLLFYDPDCHDCQALIRQLSASFLIHRLSRDNRLKIVALYPNEDIEAWKAYGPLIPEEWINAYDSHQSILNEEIYDLKATPLLYLLDKEKKVLLKDATFRQIEDYLREAPQRQTSGA